VEAGSMVQPTDRTVSSRLQRYSQSQCYLHSPRDSSRKFANSWTQANTQP
jgi:hypothetical protein